MKNLPRFRLSGINVYSMKILSFIGLYFEVQDVFLLYNDGSFRFINNFSMSFSTFSTNDDELPTSKS